MRLLLEFELKNNILPLDYRSGLLSFIKRSLSQANDKVFDRLYKDTDTKDFCFTAIFQKPIYQKDQIILGGNGLKLLLSTDDRGKTGLHLFSAFIAQKKQQFLLPMGNAMTLVRISQQSQATIKSSKIIVKTAMGSGLCVREHNRETNQDKYYVYNDPEFDGQLQLVLYKQVIGAGFTKHQADNIRFKPITCKKVVAKHYSIYIDLTVGMFALEGHPDVLQYLYNAGIASRHSNGFGVIDLVTDDCL